MPNVTLSIKEDLLKAGRAYAQKHNTSLNELIRQLLENRIKKQNSKSVDELFDLMDKAHGDSHGQTWQRAEIYER